MDNIHCPNCGKNLEQGSFICDSCGTPILQDSQMITISGGEFGGPGLINLEEKEQEMYIHQGEERVITAQGKTADTFEVAPPDPDKLPAGTVVSEEIFTWQGEAKEPKVPLVTAKIDKNVPPITPTYRKPAPKVIRTEMGDRGDKKKRTGRASKNFPKRKYPWYYQTLFYGIPGIMLLGLVGFTIFQLINPTKSQVNEEKSVKQIWLEATDKAGKARVIELQANEYEFKNQKRCIERLKKACEYYQKAIDLGGKAWETNIEILKEQKGMTRSQVEGSLQFGGYQENIKEWKNERNRILSKLKYMQRKSIPASLIPSALEKWKSSQEIAKDARQLYLEALQLQKKQEPQSIQKLQKASHLYKSAIHSAKDALQLDIKVLAANRKITVLETENLPRYSLYRTEIQKWRNVRRQITNSLEHKTVSSSDPIWNQACDRGEKADSLYKNIFKISEQERLLCDRLYKQAITSGESAQKALVKLLIAYENLNEGQAKSSQKYREYGQKIKKWISNRNQISFIQRYQAQWERVDALLKNSEILYKKSKKSGDLSDLKQASQAYARVILEAMQVQNQNRNFLRTSLFSSRQKKIYAWKKIRSEILEKIQKTKVSVATPEADRLWKKALKYASYGRKYEAKAEKSRGDDLASYKAFRKAYYRYRKAYDHAKKASKNHLSVLIRSNYSRKQAEQIVQTRYQKDTNFWYSKRKQMWKRYKKLKKKLK